MIGRIALVALQIVIGWWGTPAIERYVSVGGDQQVFIKAAIAAAIIWLVGLSAGLVWKPWGRPSPEALAWALAGGLAGAAIVVFRVPQMLGVPLPAPPLAILLALAIAGYHIKR